MTKVEVYECDECGCKMDEDDFRKADVDMKQCMICNKDYCWLCAEEHAKVETGLSWRNRND